ncbi:hypothetical protein M011DRAFT_487585 [Sporormia fimetaria CBS 119925]|uniref:Uncharacterized protein n=1 Tax=Sporormia fimetaria CBS 119925 TaxID=1340428 RepID=A0A6A6V8Q6_9PLEO|nr:hypothetical protein M011DRAFT_487585 [Sporormia fimetaria CBS 119925]
MSRASQASGPLNNTAMGTAHASQPYTSFPNAPGLQSTTAGQNSCTARGSYTQSPDSGYYTTAPTPSSEQISFGGADSYTGPQATGYTDLVPHSAGVSAFQDHTAAFGGYDQSSFLNSNDATMAGTASQSLYPSSGLHEPPLSEQDPTQPATSHEEHYAALGTGTLPTGSFPDSHNGTMSTTASDPLYSFQGHLDQPSNNGSIPHDAHAAPTPHGFPHPTPEGPNQASDTSGFPNDGLGSSPLAQEFDPVWNYDILSAEELEAILDRLDQSRKG